MANGTADRGAFGIGLGGILVIVGIILAIVWSVWVGIIVALVVLVVWSLAAVATVRLNRWCIAPRCRW